MAGINFTDIALPREPEAVYGRIGRNYTMYNYIRLLMGVSRSGVRFCGKEKSMLFKRQYLC
ncbi:hypothetical protein OBV_37710 [Oscillibacter valericigenes Sjm18-20]|nr:hypothetical protein OBV_37710 [Oscillibacter valericigenes Sjm18-20]